MLQHLLRIHKILSLKYLNNLYMENIHHWVLPLDLCYLFNDMQEIYE